MILTIFGLHDVDFRNVLKNIYHICIGLLPVIYVIYVPVVHLSLGTVIMLFLFLGVLFHGTPVAYVRAFGKAASGAAGIILQFPFYAGIMGIITGVGESGICFGTVIRMRWNTFWISIRIWSLKGRDLCIYSEGIPTT